MELVDAVPVRDAVAVALGVLDTVIVREDEGVLLLLFVCVRDADVV